MAIEWRLGTGYTIGSDYTTGTSAAATSMVANKPTGLQNGETLRAYFYSQASTGAAATPPAGWTLEVAPTQRRGGIYRKVVATASSEPSNYTWTAPATGRVVLVIWRCTGEATVPIDVAGAFTTEATTATTPSLTAAAAGNLLVVFAYWNASTAATITATFPGSMTKRGELQSPTTGNTSGIAMAAEVLSAPGATGTRAVTASPTPTNMSAVAIVYAAAATGASGTAASALPALGQAAAGTVTVPAGTGVAASLTPAVTQSAAGTAAAPALPGYSVAQMDADIAAGHPVHWAHRGGSANWSEMTMFAYDNAIAWGVKCLEVSVQRSSDGVWIMSHDATLTRVTGNAVTIVSTPSSSMLGMAVTAPSSGGVIGRLEDLLAAYPEYVLLVDNKPGSFYSAFLDLLETVPNAHDQIVVKLDGEFGTLANFQAAKARGFKTAGYWYPNNYAANLPAKAPYTDYIGMQYDATAGEWADIFAYGKSVWGHVLQNTTQYNQVKAAGADIFQVANVTGLIPEDAVYGNVTSALPAVGQSAAGTFAIAPRTGTAASALPALSQSAAGTFSIPPRTGAAASALPAVSQSGTGVVTGPPGRTGTAASSLPSLTQSAAGTVVNPAGRVGTITSTLPTLSQAAAGTFVPPGRTGVAASALPTLTQAAAGDVDNPTTTGVAASTLPAVATSATGTRTAPVYAGTAASAPLPLVQSASGTTGAPGRSGAISSILPAVTQAAYDATVPCWPEMELLAASGVRTLAPIDGALALVAVDGGTTLIPRGPVIELVEDGCRK